MKQFEPFFCDSGEQNICSKILVPSCQSYYNARQIYNRSIQKYPAGIIYCENECDAAQAVRFASKRGLTVRIRSGGHNYEGFSIGDKALVIDTSRFKNREINEDEGTVHIGSGVNNEELYGLLGEYGYPFPSGTCPTVSAAGLTQGGGWGHSARMFGLACDKLLEVEIIDAQGNLIVASKGRNQDLFWALRGGGGGNFGVVTSLKYQLPPKLSYVTYIDIRYSKINALTACRFFHAWQEWLSRGDIRFTPNSRIFNSADEGMGIYLRGFYYGTPEEAEYSIRPFLEIRGAAASLKYVTFWEATKIDASFYPPSERFRFAGRFVRRAFSQYQIETILRLVKHRAPGATYASIALYALGGKVRDIAPYETAFFYRHADFIIGIETVWETPSACQANLNWLKPRFEILKSATSGSYINFPYLGTDNYMNAYYGSNAKRLAHIKELYDPGCLFTFPQKITY